jgi:hypothetical protein
MKMLAFILVFGCTIFSYAQRIPPLKTGQWGIGPTRPPRCYPLLDDAKIGVVYGALQNLFGIRLQAVHWLPLIRTTDVDYRARHNDNAYFNIEVGSQPIKEWGSTRLILNLGYKRILIDNRSVNNQFTAGSTLFRGLHGITCAYARRYHRSFENPAQYDDGVLLQWYHELFQELQVTARGIYWFNEFHYAVKMDRQIIKSDFSISLGYEKLGTWDEIGIALLYVYR